MLVKFLSLIASVLGTDRYKPVVFSCFALLLASTGILAIAMFHQPPVEPATSQITSAQGESTNPQRQSSQLGGPRQQLPEDPGLQSKNSNEIPPSNSTSNPQTDTTTSESRPSASPGTTDLVMQLSGITMSAGNVTSPISAASSDSTKLEWSIVAQGNESHVQVLTEPLKETSASIRMRFRADTDTSAGTYSFLITAKDTARSINLTKTFTVTVSP